MKRARVDMNPLRADFLAVALAVADAHSGIGDCRICGKRADEGYCSSHAGRERSRERDSLSWSGRIR